MAIPDNFLMQANFLANELGAGNMEWQLLGLSQAKSKLYASKEEAAPLAERISNFFRSIGYPKMAASFPSRQGEGYRVVILNRNAFSTGLSLYQRAFSKAFAQANNQVPANESLPAEVNLLKQRLEALCLQSWTGESLSLGLQLKEKLPILSPETCIEIKKAGAEGSYLMEVASQQVTLVPSLQSPNFLVPVPSHIEEQILTDEDVAFALQAFNEANEHCNWNG